MIEEHERHFRDTESDYFSFFNYYLQACDLKKHHACSRVVAACQNNVLLLWHAILNRTT